MKVITGTDIFFYVLTLVLLLVSAIWGIYLVEEPIFIPGLKPLVEEPFFAFVLFTFYFGVFVFLLVPSLRGGGRVIFISGMLFGGSLICMAYFSFGPFIIMMLVSSGIYSRNSKIL